MQVEVTREIDAPPSRVWEVITDLEHSAQVVSGIEQVERLDDHDGFVVGTRWRETRTMFGKQATEEMEVTAIVPERSYTTLAEHGSNRYVSNLEVAPRDDGHSRLTMSFEGTSTSGVGRIMTATVGRLMRSTTRKMLQQDLDDIATAAEATTAP